VKELNPLAASSRIQNEFERRGWRLAEPFPVELVREILRAGGIPNAATLAVKVPHVFLVVNRITPTEVQSALARALNGVRVVDTAAGGMAVTNVYNGKVEHVTNNNEINNSGQWVGNVDSPNSSANVERQQQAEMTPADEHALRAHVDDAEVQKVLALDLSLEEKAPLVGSRLAKAANVAKDVAVDFAVKLIAEMVRPT
jgi:hypothetical protein